MRGDRPEAPLAYRIRNRDAAEEPPIIYIHGAMSAGTIWLVLSRKLAAVLPRRQGYLVDLPGHGGSPGGPLTSIDAHAAAVIELMDTLGLERATLVGHSLGGAVAQTLALEHPHRVERLALLATGAVLGVSPMILEALAADFDGAVSMVKEFVFAGEAPEALLEPAMAVMRSAGAEVALADFRACLDFDSRGRLGEVGCPCLVACGERDVMTSPKNNRLLAESLGCPYHEIPGAGHMLPLEGADQLVDIIGGFVRGDGARTPPA